MKWHLCIKISPLTFLLIHNVSPLIINSFNTNKYIFKVLLYSSNVRSRCFELFMFGWVAKLQCQVMCKEIELSFLISVFFSTFPAKEDLTSHFFLRICLVQDPGVLYHFPVTMFSEEIENTLHCLIQDFCLLISQFKKHFKCEVNVKLKCTE